MRKRKWDEAFRKATASEKDASLFETYIWPLKVEGKAARDAILRMVAQPASGWKLVDQAEHGNGGFLLHLGGKGLLGGKGKHSTVLISQLAPNESKNYAKFWDYAMGQNFVITLTGELKGLVPTSEAQRKAVGEEFRQRLVKELDG